MKPDQSDVKEVKELATAFETRYNRKVKVFRAITIADGKVKVARIRIVSPRGNYELTEHLNEQELTDYVLVQVGEKEHKFKTYLEAEVFVADKIGEE